MAKRISKKTRRCESLAADSQIKLKLQTLSNTLNLVRKVVLKIAFKKLNINTTCVEPFKFFVVKKQGLVYS